MTAISSARPGDDTEVVRDEDHRHVALALLLLQQVADLRLCTVTSRAVVGSSANRSFGHTRARWRSRLADACLRTGAGIAKRRSASGIRRT